MKGIKLNVINVIIGISVVLLLWISYSVLSTVVIRTYGQGVMKKVQRQGILLTFDDGPNPHYTPQLLDLLKSYNVKACFFVVGSKVNRYPEIIQRMAAEGHVVGIHHYEHISNWILTPWQLNKQLKSTEQAIIACTNEPVKFYRPPWGHFNFATPFLSKQYQVMMWSHLFWDWNVSKSKDTMLDHMRKAAVDGAIFLLHDCGETFGADRDAPACMLQQLAIFLEECENKGTQFINLKES